MPHLRPRLSQQVVDCSRRNTSVCPSKYKGICPFLKDFVKDCLQFDDQVRTSGEELHKCYLSYVKARTTDPQQVTMAKSIYRFGRHFRGVIPPSWYEPGSRGRYKCVERGHPTLRSNRQLPDYTLQNVRQYLSIPVYQRPIKFRKQYISPILQHGVVTTSQVLQDEVLCVYSGERISSAERACREETYAAQNQAMTIFTLPDGSHIDPNFDEDGTSRDPDFPLWKYINHSRSQPNAVSKPYRDDRGMYHVIIVAKSDIASGVQLLYDYQDFSRTSVDAEWLKK